MNEQVLQQAYAYIDEHKDAMIEDLMRLVRIPSISVRSDTGAPFGENCLKALRTMLEMGGERGFDVKLYDDRVGRLALRDGDADVGFWGHLDVVPEGGNWTHAPYEPVYENGCVIGRGASDNKGASVGMLYVLSCLKALGVPLKKNYALYLGTDEEKGMSDVDYFVERFTPPKMSIVTDCGFPVCYAEKGILEADLISIASFSDNVQDLQGGVASNVVPDSASVTLKKTDELLSRLESPLPEGLEAEVLERSVRLTARGITGHTAHPQGSVNAIRVLTAGLLELACLPEEDLAILHFINKVNEDVYGTTLHIACEDEISGRLTCVGSTIGLRDGRAVLSINIRYPVKERDQKLVGSILTTCASYGFTMEIGLASAPNHFPQSHPAVAILTQVYNEAMGEDAKPYAMAGGTYARRLPNALAYGPGFPGRKLPEGMFAPGHGGAHGPDEALVVDDLIRAMKIYVKAILTLDEADI